MNCYIGLDVSQEECAICILEEDGTPVFEGSCLTDPGVILRTIAEHADAVAKIVHESGPLSIWLTRELMKRGAPVVCIDARAAHKALSARMNKSDRSDAEALAQLARTGWYREVHVKSEESDRLRLLLSARERLIRIRMDIEAQARGILKTFGIRLGPVRAGWSRRDFRDQLSEIVSGDPILEAVFAIGTKRLRESVRDAVNDLPASAGHRERIFVAARTHLSTLLAQGDYTSANIRNFGQIPEAIQLRHREDRRRRRRPTAFRRSSRVRRGSRRSRGSGSRPVAPHDRCTGRARSGRRDTRPRIRKRASVAGSR